MIGTIEWKLINGVLGSDNLVKARTSVQSDEMEFTIMRTKILDSIGT